MYVKKMCIRKGKHIENELLCKVTYDEVYLCICLKEVQTDN